MRAFSVAALLAHTGANIACGGCDPLSSDRARLICDACSAPASIAVPCSAGWRSLNGAHHAVTYCPRCWDLLQSVRKRSAPPLAAIAITLVGPEPHKKVRPAKSTAAEQAVA